VTRPRELSIIIPAYNEETRIGGVLENYLEVLDREFPGSYELIVVCNGCTDKTFEITTSFSKKSDSIVGLCFEKRLGKGGAIIEGFKAAKGRLVGFMDADESTEAEEYLKLVRILEKEGVDGAIASRRVEGARIEVKQPFFRRFASRTFNLFVRSIFNLDFKDTQCGAKVFRGKSIQGVLGGLSSKGFEFDVELLWRMMRVGNSIVEVPITWRHEGGSTFGLRYAPKMFFRLLALRILG